MGPFIASILVLLCLDQVAYGYVDPGTGSFLVQGIVAAIASILATFKYWSQFITGSHRQKIAVKQEPSLKERSPHNP